MITTQSNLEPGTVDIKRLPLFYFMHKNEKIAVTCYFILITSMEIIEIYLFYITVQNKVYEFWIKQLNQNYVLLLRVV